MKERNETSREASPYFVNNEGFRANAVLENDEVVLKRDYDYEPTLDELSLNKYRVEIEGRKFSLSVRAANEEEAKNFVNETCRDLQPEKFADKDAVIKCDRNKWLSWEESNLLSKAMTDRYLEKDGDIPSLQTMAGKLDYLDKLEDARDGHEKTVAVEQDIAKSFMDQLSQETQDVSTEEQIRAEDIGQGRLASLSYIAGDNFRHYANENEVHRDEESDWSLGAITIRTTQKNEIPIPVKELSVEKRLSYMSAIDKVKEGEMEWVYLSNVKADEEIVPALREGVLENREEINHLKDSIREAEAEEFETGLPDDGFLIEEQDKLVDLESYDYEEKILDMIGNDEKLASQILEDERTNEKEEPEASDDLKKYNVKINDTVYTLEAASPKDAYIMARDDDIEGQRMERNRKWYEREVLDHDDEDYEHEFDDYEDDFDREVKEKPLYTIEQIGPSRTEERKLQTELEDAIDAGKSVRPQTQGGRLKALQMIDRANMENHYNYEFQRARHEIETDLFDDLSHDTQGRPRDTVFLDDVDLKGVNSISYNQYSQSIDIETEENGTYSMSLDSVPEEKRLPYIAAAERLSEEREDDALSFLGDTRADDEIASALSRNISQDDRDTIKLVRNLAGGVPEYMEALPEEPEPWRPEKKGAASDLESIKAALGIEDEEPSAEDIDAPSHSDNGAR